MSFVRDFRASASKHNAPGTVALIVAFIAFFLLEWSRVAAEQLVMLLFFTTDAHLRPWSFLTYPFVGGAPSLIGLVFLCWWIWGIGGTVEKEVGTLRYIAAFFIFAVLCAAGIWIGASALGTHTMLSWGWTPVAAITIMWGTRHPETTILLMFVLPIKAKYVAWLSAGLVFFGTRHPMLAPFAAAPLALAYFYAADKLPLPYNSGTTWGEKKEQKTKTRIHIQNEEKYFNDVRRREKDREERERLRKLFEESMKDE
ncbi:MAG TPA: rhomboid family intramembrane serine protease [Fimbriimonadaceae bacterium]|nr:rhomboid family intramembrane serine protease [Fimbriimonadaceae bacterium]